MDQRGLAERMGEFILCQIEETTPEDTDRKSRCADTESISCFPALRPEQVDLSAMALIPYWQQTVQHMADCPSGLG